MTERVRESILAACCRAIALTGLCMVVIKWISVFTGLIMYARYYKCDPITTKVYIFFSLFLSVRN